jgi:23S rRNA pseudouridine1911/1915/1917 synthase
LNHEIISTDPQAGGGWAVTEEGDDVEPGVERRHLRVDVGEHGLRIDKWLAGCCPEFSRAYFQQLLADGAVSVNGRPQSKASAKLRAGDAVEVELRPTAQAQAFQPEPIPLSVVYEDAHLLVVDKPAGLVVHPAAGHWSGTLLNALLAHHAGAAALPRAGIVHRLDKDTSGLMLVGKTVTACEALVRMIAARRVHRIYVALVEGAWRGEDERLVDRPVGRDPRNRLRMAVLAEGHAAGKPAQTSVRVLSRGAAHAWVGCKLHTGRTHQIRVHLASLGHPLVGDATYGGRPLAGLARQALHAHRLALSHPVTGAWLQLESPLPEDIAQALAEAGLDYNLEKLWQVSEA